MSELAKAIGDKRYDEAMAWLAADPARGAQRDTPNSLMLALYHGQRALAEAIAARRTGFDVHEAAALGRLGDLEAALRAEPSLANAPASDGFAPLHLACYFGQEAAAERLLAAGADADLAVATPSRLRPLHGAASRGSVALCRRLLDAGADPDARQHGGFTALHSAALHGNEALVQLLLERGARTDLAADDGRRAADFARDGGHVALAQRLA